MGLIEICNLVSGSSPLWVTSRSLEPFPNIYLLQISWFLIAFILETISKERMPKESQIVQKPEQVLGIFQQKVYQKYRISMNNL